MGMSRQKIEQTIPTPPLHPADLKGCRQVFVQAPQEETVGVSAFVCEIENGFSDQEIFRGGDFEIETAPRHDGHRMAHTFDECGIVCADDPIPNGLAMGFKNPIGTKYLRGLSLPDPISLDGSLDPAVSNLLECIDRRNTENACAYLLRLSDSDCQSLFRNEGPHRIVNENEIGMSLYGAEASIHRLLPLFTTCNHVDGNRKIDLGEDFFPTIGDILLSCNQNDGIHMTCKGLQAVTHHGHAL